ncbi:MAG: hypothetical protein AAB588_03630 [Patescibacteria group bacterium]
MKNRWIVAIAIIAVVIGMLSACGKTEPAKPSTQDVPQVPSSRGPSAPPKVSKPTAPLPR